MKTRSYEQARPELTSDSMVNVRRGIVLAAIAVVASGELARGASAIWNVNTAGNWVDDVNWNPAAAPGAASGTANSDTATFGTIINAARVVTVDANRNIQNIDFAGNSSAYTLSGGNLLLTNGGSVQTSGGGSGHTDIISSPISLQGDGGAYSFLGGSSSATRVLSIQGSIEGVSTGANLTTLTLGGANTANNVVTGIIGGASTGNKISIVKTGAGTWNLTPTANNTFTGSTTVLAGTLIVNQAGAFGSAANPDILVGDTTGSTTATLNTSVAISNAHRIRIQSNTSGGTVTLRSSGASNVRNSSSIVLGSNNGAGRGITLTNADLNGYVGIISDPTNMTAGTAGLVTISGSNNVYFGNIASTYSGGTTLSAGALSFNTGGTGTWVGSGVFTINGGSLNQQSSAATVNGFSSLVLNVNLSTANRANTFNGPVNLGATGTATTRTFTVGGDSLTFGGTLSDGTNGTTTGIIKAGNNPMILAGASNYTGGTTVNAGTLQLSTGNDRLPVTTTLSLAGQSAAAGAFGTFDLNTRNQTVAGLTGGAVSGTGTSPGNVTNAAAGTGTATLTVTGGSTFDGVIKNGATAKVGLTKSTGGVLVLTGANTYTGPTSITGGTLLVNGSIVSPTTLSGSGTIGGSGTVGAITAASGTTIAPGNSPAVLTTTGNVTLDAGTLAIELALIAPTDVPTAGTNYDQLSSSVDASTVSLTNGNLGLAVGAGLELNDTFYIVSNAGTDATAGPFANLNGVAATLTEGSQFEIGGYTFQITYAADWTGDPGTSSLAGGNDVALQVVPEPAGLASLGLIAASSLMRRKRR